MQPSEIEIGPAIYYTPDLRPIPVRIISTTIKNNTVAIEVNQRPYEVAINRLITFQEHPNTSQRPRNSSTQIPGYISVAAYCAEIDYRLANRQAALITRYCTIECRAGDVPIWRCTKNINHYPHRIVEFCHKKSTIKPTKK